MNFQSHFLVSHLLLLFFYPRDAMVEEDIVWGILTKSISLDIPDFPNHQNIEDIRWFKGQTLIAKIKLNGDILNEKNTAYQIFKNGTLKIKKLEKDSGQDYKVAIYNKDGKNVLEKTLTLNVIEAVSKPEITWDCTKESVTCEVQNGTDAELTLFDDETRGGPLKMGTLKGKKMHLKYTWKYPPLKEFKCVVKNRVSEDWAVSQNPCTVKILNIYHILGICGGGVILLIFVVLVIFLRRKKQNDQNVEINISRVKVEGRGQKFPPSPGHHPQLHGGHHPQQSGGHHPQIPGHHPQAPGHRLQVPGHGPAVPGHRHQPQQKKPSPKVQQQTGPPLPRPRNQQKPSH